MQAAVSGDLILHTCVEVCCSVLPCVAVCCSQIHQRHNTTQHNIELMQAAVSGVRHLLLHTSVLQCAAVCCRVLQCVAVCCSQIPQRHNTTQQSVELMQPAMSGVRHLISTPVCCSVLQCVAVRCRELTCVAVCCSVLQCVAVRCIVLQCVAVC